MLTGPRRRAVPEPPPAPEDTRDAGFTLVEVLVAIMLVGIVMTALTAFFVGTVSVVSHQGGMQVAAQLADDGVERVHALRGSAVAAGRDKTSSDSQWASPVPRVAPYLADMQETWDAVASYPAGASAPLPTTAKTVTVNGVAYGQNWYVGKCWQAPAGGDCGATATTGYVEFFRVVVAVTWSAKPCGASACSYVTSTVVSNASSDPYFDPNLGVLPPTVNDPGDHSGEVSVAASLQLTATGGVPPLTWSADGLPPGLTVTSTGLISGSPSAAGVYAVTATATDGGGLADSSSFTWTINDLPTLVSPGDQATLSGTPVSLTIGRSGGTAPFTWSATGLPAGLSINASTGLISGTPTTVRPATDVTVAVSDTFGKSASTTFKWAIAAPLQVQTPTARTAEIGIATVVQITATGGAAPYTWSASGLPPGLSIDSSGKISGTPTTTGTYPSVVATVADAAGSTASTSAFNWTVVAAPTITAPAGTPYNAKGTTINLQATVSAGVGPYSWTATNLPTGLTISSAGLISGTLTAPGSYAVTVTVTDSLGGTSTVSFTWNVLGITSPSGPQSEQLNRQVNLIPVATGGSGTYTWSATGLPTGLTIRASDGKISGRPSARGTYNVTLTVTDTITSLSASLTFTWTIT